MSLLLFDQQARIIAHGTRLQKQLKIYTHASSAPVILWLVYQV
jgi:hypothetical protein